MAPLILEGDTLGEKHRYYNKVLKEAVSSDDIQQIKDIDYDEPDVDNLFKIDIASNQRNVEYILKVLKCDDMVYVSRALKVSVWLITDKQYEHIINPEYIHTQLFPEFTSKAKTKLLLNIRLNLKDEKRVEDFCNYFKENDIKTAQKWLPNCSLPFIEQFVEEYTDDISDNLLKRLCEKSITILEIVAKKSSCNNKVATLISNTTFLLNTKVERYLRVLDSFDNIYFLRFNSKTTNIIMNKSPDTILNNIKKYISIINIPTFVKHLKKENVKEFLTVHAKNESVRQWFTFENLNHFIRRIPHEDRFNYVKNIFIDKVDPDSAKFNTNETMLHRFPIRRRRNTSASWQSNSIYRWYKFAPFETVYKDLGNMIRAASHPMERADMFDVMIISAGRNLQNIKLVLQYFHDRHINEPFKFKKHFVKTVFIHSNTHRFDKDTWNILNDILYSMEEVYSESDVDVQRCVHSIIVYNVVHDIEVPDVIRNKFEFESLKSLQRKFNEEERNKVFNFLFEFSMSQLTKIKVSFATAAKYLNAIVNIMNLLIDWKKDLLEYGLVVEKIYKLIEISQRESWNMDLSHVYNLKKSWRKHMFSESLLLYPSLEVCLNALKHKPDMLTSKNIIDIFNNGSVSLVRCFNKIRTYYPTTLATYFRNYFLDELAQNQSHIKYKLCISGLCALLPPEQLKYLLINFAPSEHKINWSQSDKQILTIQQMCARHMILARPQLPLEVVLVYAKDDFLQYSLPTIKSVLYNLSCTRSRNYIELLLDTPVSMQKHGLRFAFTRLESKEMVKICFNTWNSSKNLSLRSVIFKIMFDLLCKQQNESMITDIWSVMESMIDDLKCDENRTIYEMLSKVCRVPLKVRPAFCVKSYTFLKSLPAKNNCDSIINSVIRSTLYIMEFLNAEFVADIIFDSFDEHFTLRHFTYSCNVSACLLSLRSETSQTPKYDVIFVELLKRYMNLSNKVEKQYYLKRNFLDVLHQILSDFTDIVLEKQMLTPKKLFKDILSDLIKHLPEEDNYVLLTTWKLATRYIETLDKYRTSDISEKPSVTSKWDFLHLKVAPEFAQICIQILKDDTENYFLSFYTLFGEALMKLIEKLSLSDRVHLSILKYIHEHTDFIAGQLLVLKILPTYRLDNKSDEEEKCKILHHLSTHPSAEVRVPSKNVLPKTTHYNYA